MEILDTKQFPSFFLLRHGPSIWNHKSRWQGQKNPRLSREGAKLALAWAKAIRTEMNGVPEPTPKPIFGEIWASDLRRARRTAEIIGKELEIPVTIDTRLRERKLGEWEGLTHPEIVAGWPGALERREFPSGSENDGDVLKRVLGFLKERLDSITEEGEPSSPKSLGLPTLLVAHGGIITCIEEHLGAKWERLSNLKGRWVFVKSSHKIEDLYLGDRNDYLNDRLSDYTDLDHPDRTKQNDPGSTDIKWSE